jgi:hypothetical protein
MHLSADEQRSDACRAMCQPGVPGLPLPAHHSRVACSILDAFFRSLWWKVLVFLFTQGAAQP